MRARVAIASKVDCEWELRIQIDVRQQCMRLRARGLITNRVGARGPSRASASGGAKELERAWCKDTRWVVRRLPAVALTPAAGVPGT